MSPRQSVLIVDRLPETREVLRTVLECRGWDIIEADAPTQGAEMVRKHHPDLVVLDLETDPVPSDYDCEAILAASDQSATPIVMLGNIRRETRISTNQAVLRKPYHYAPLIRKIEELLAGSERAAA